MRSIASKSKVKPDRRQLGHQRRMKPAPRRVAGFKLPLLPDRSVAVEQQAWRRKTAGLIARDGPALPLSSRIALDILKRVREHHLQNQPMQAMCRKCFASLGQRASVCDQCGAPVEDPTPAPISDIQPAMAAVRSDSDLRTRSDDRSGGRSDLRGIGGWLILVAITLFLAPIEDVYRVYSDLTTLYGGGFAQMLADHPGLTKLLVTQIVGRHHFLYLVFSR